MPEPRSAINRRAAAARRAVLARLRREQPATYEQWLAEAYDEYDRNQLVDDIKRRLATHH
jgi:hypothetical protein